MAWSSRGWSVPRQARIRQRLLRSSLVMFPGSLPSLLPPHCNWRLLGKLPGLALQEIALWPTGLLWLLSSVTKDSDDFLSVSWVSLPPCSGEFLRNLSFWFLWFCSAPAIVFFSLSYPVPLLPASLLHAWGVRKFFIYYRPILWNTQTDIVWK